MMIMSLKLWEATPVDGLLHTPYATIFISVKYQPILHIVLYQPEIPPNTGNVGRTCVAVGAKLWLVRPLGFQIDDRQLARSGLDYWQHLEWEAVDDWQQFLLSREPMARAVTNNRWYFTKTAQRSYLDVQYNAGDALIFGPETSGLPPSLIQEAGDRALRIPTRDEVRSLNLASAVAVAAYEALRQITNSS